MPLMIEDALPWEGAEILGVAPRAVDRRRGADSRCVRKMSRTIHVETMRAGSRALTVGLALE